MLNLLKAVWQWIRTHKTISIIFLMLLLLLFEYITLPRKSEIQWLSNHNPKITTLMEIRKKEAKEKGYNLIIQQKWVPLSQISDHLKHAVIVAEDGTFFEHEGIDWYEVKESIKKDIKKGKFVRGASTITQQLAKNLFLSTSKDPIRKLKEFLIAKMLEDELSKSRILELYLNVIEWGNGIFGAESAAMIYFGKHASELTREEASRLAATLPSPLQHQPNSEQRYVKFRRNIILARMEARGW
jgi:monofunctional biosynthetic peptidoglycan transglycosylase